MGVRFTIGHVGGGTKKLDVPPDAVRAALVSLLEELYDADDEHFQGYVLNSSEASMTVIDNGLMVWDMDVNRSADPSLYCRPSTQADAVEILTAFVHLQTEAFADRFGPEKPPSAPGLDFLLIGMGEFALSRAASSRNFVRVKQLVEAGHDVNQRTPEGSTPLMGAVGAGQAKMCRYLIEHGADVTVRLPSDGWGSGGWSLRRLARAEDYPDVESILEQAGAPE